MGKPLSSSRACRPVPRGRAGRDGRDRVADPGRLRPGGTRCGGHRPTGAGARARPGPGPGRRRRHRLLRFRQRRGDRQAAGRHPGDGLHRRRQRLHRRDAQEFAQCYEPTWGRHKARTMPAVGNHEYQGSPVAAGYFDYFGSAAGEPGQGWYDYRRGAWHVIVLNSMCDAVGGCGAGSPQERWLRGVLAASDAECTVAIMHHTQFSSGVKHGAVPRVLPLWQALYEFGAEMVLSGHDHHYERFAMQTPGGRSTPPPGSGSSSWEPAAGITCRALSGRPQQRGPRPLDLRRPEADPPRRQLRLAVRPRGGQDVHRPGHLRLPRRTHPAPAAASPSARPHHAGGVVVERLLQGALEDHHRPAGGDRPR